MNKVNNAENVFYWNTKEMLFSVTYFKYVYVSYGPV